MVRSEHSGLPSCQIWLLKNIWNWRFLAGCRNRINTYTSLSWNSVVGSRFDVLVLRSVYVYRLLLTVILLLLFYRYFHSFFRHLKFEVTFFINFAIVWCDFTNIIHIITNSLSTSFTKWSNTLKQFVGKLPTNCLCVFDYFVGLARKGLIYITNITQSVFLHLHFSKYFSSVFFTFYKKLINAWTKLLTY